MPARLLWARRWPEETAKQEERTLRPAVVIDALESNREHEMNDDPTECRNVLTWVVVTA